MILLVHYGGFIMRKLFVLCFVFCMAISGAYASNSKYVNYDPYEGELKNQVLETKTVSNAGISIEKKKLKPVSNLVDYAMCFEYIIKNDTGHDIVITSVEAKEKISQGGMFGRSLIPQKSDFIPGLSIAKDIQEDRETGRFMRSLPQNEKIKAYDSMRVLIVAPKSSENPATFSFESNRRPVTIRVE